MSLKNTILESYPWIDLDFVQTLVNKSDYDKNLTVDSFRAEKGVNDGKNFSSTTIRLFVNLLQSNNQSNVLRVYFLKVCLQTDDFVKACEECLYYEKEIEVFSEILPAVEELLQSINEPSQLAAKCYYADIGRGVLVFEDLNVGNFVTVHQADGMHVSKVACDNCCIAFKGKFFKFDKLDALTSDRRLVKQRPELFDWTTRIMYKNAKTIEEKLINVPSHVYDNMYQEYLPTENAFNVLLHGDMWSNNIMFVYDQNGKPTDIRLVDFALCKHTNPSYDLALLLYGSSQSRSITEADRERLVQFYYVELIKLLKRLKYPKKLPTLLDIQTVVFRFDLYNALIVLFVIGLRYSGESFDGGFMELAENTQNSEEKSARMYSHPKCIEELKYLLDMFDRRGYFDCQN